MSKFSDAVTAYGEWGVDVESAIDDALAIPISIHCWQADDVAGFEVKDAASSGGGIMATGNYPGRARNADEVRADLAKVISLVPGAHRVNLHASYAETAGKPVERDELEPAHFANWMGWAKQKGVSLDFNPTYFAHPKADSGFTLSSSAPDIRKFWIRHGIASRKIAAAMSAGQGNDCVNNHWIPDGAKDHPADRWTPRQLLVESLDEILTEPISGCVDAVESKLFGLGSEDYVVGSFEFYTQYALSRGKLFCLDMGHFHPTESIADKVSSLLQFQDRILLHTSRPVRWDSDHIVIFSDELKNVFLEFKRGGAMNRMIVALDFFDASVNRIAAYVLGIRSTRKALLYALLDPTARLQELEIQGKIAQKLAVMEEAKCLPFGEVWNELCRRTQVAEGLGWIPEVEGYEDSVLSAR